MPEFKNFDFKTSDFKISDFKNADTKKLRLTDDPPRHWSRNQKVEHFMPMAHREANKIKGYLFDRPSLGLEPDDILSVSAMAIVRAVDRFDAGRGVKMSTWVISKVKIAVLEALRDARHEPRSMTEKGQSVHWTLFSTPTRGLSDDGPSTVGDSMEQRLSDPSADVLSQIVFKEDTARLGAMIDRLPPRERHVLVAKLENHWMTNRQVSDLMGVSESRVHHLLQEAMLQLKVIMRDELLRERSQYESALRMAQG